MTRLGFDGSDTADAVELKTAFPQNSFFIPVSELSVGFTGNAFYQERRIAARDTKMAVIEFPANGSPGNVNFQFGIRSWIWLFGDGVYRIGVTFFQDAVTPAPDPAEFVEMNFSHYGVRHGQSFDITPPVGLETDVQILNQNLTTIWFDNIPTIGQNTADNTTFNNFVSRVQRTQEASDTFTESIYMVGFQVQKTTDFTDLAAWGTV